MKIADKKQKVIFDSIKHKFRSSLTIIEQFKYRNYHPYLDNLPTIVLHLRVELRIRSHFTVHHRRMARSRHE